MILLMLFAVVAGAGTALSPCVLPVLPALLSAGATGGRRRPLGIVIGLVVTYTVAIVALASVTKGVGLSGGATRTIAIVALISFGLILAIPGAGDRLEARLAPLGRLGSGGSRTKGDGFATGLLVGGALGFLYAPCAGPILAAVISVSASQGTSLKLVFIALAYGLGSGIVLFGLSLGGRALLDRVRRAGRGPMVQRVLAGVLIVTGVAMAANLDTRFQTALASHVPDALVNPTKALEDSSAVGSRLNDLRGRSRFDSAHAPAQKVAAAGTAAAAPTASSLPVLGAAPDFVGNQRWFNTPHDKPLSLAQLKGRVVLVDFWTYTCINCIRTLPFLKELDTKYRKDGLTIVGVHTPEFGFEHKASNVADAIHQNGLRYPVAQDNDYATWNAWGNQYWPAEYLIDAKGNVRATNFGEGDYAKSERNVRALLTEAGAKDLGASAHAHGVPVGTQVATPETYIGTARTMGFVGDRPHNGVSAYREVVGKLAPNAFALSGTWKITGESGTAVAGATLKTHVIAQHVYLVLSSQGGAPRDVNVLVDGKPTRTVTVRRQRLYELASFPRAGSHQVELRFAPGLSAFAFTFG
jgi:cytochrome c biogenesis protein CcdA/thiol-disulfide isomerase/thioredoxin